MEFNEIRALGILAVGVLGLIVIVQTTSISWNGLLTRHVVFFLSYVIVLFIAAFLLSLNYGSGEKENEKETGKTRFLINIKMSHVRFGEDGEIQVR